MKVVRWITSVILIGCLIISFTLIRGVLSEEKQNKTPVGYKGIVTIWQIDSFEGGIGSRKQFLLKVARGFERLNKGVLVMVISHTKTSYENAIKEGQVPDMVSFGGGISVNGLTRLSCKKTVAGGYIGDKVYATSWAKGCYFLIANSALVEDVPNHIPSLLISEQEYTQPTLSLMYENFSAQRIERLAPMDAYIKFVSGKTPYLLGTQRDIFRLNNRGMEVKALPLQNFNDLYQYIAITINNKEKVTVCESFVEYLLSEKVQSELTEIGMLSPYYKLLYENALNSVKLNNSQYTLSAFSPPEQLKELQSLSENALKGNEESQNKIKNIVIKS